MEDDWSLAGPGDGRVLFKRGVHDLMIGLNRYLPRAGRRLMYSDHVTSLVRAEARRWFSFGPCYQSVDGCRESCRLANLESPPIAVRPSNPSPTVCPLLNLILVCPFPTRIAARLYSSQLHCRLVAPIPFLYLNPLLCTNSPIFPYHLTPSPLPPTASCQSCATLRCSSSLAATYCPPFFSAVLFSPCAPPRPPSCGAPLSQPPFPLLFTAPDSPLHHLVSTCNNLQSQHLSPSSSHPFHSLLSLCHLQQSPPLLHPPSFAPNSTYLLPHRSSSLQPRPATLQLQPSTTRALSSSSSNVALLLAIFPSLLLLLCHRPLSLCCTTISATLQLPPPHQFLCPSFYPPNPLLRAFLFTILLVVLLFTHDHHPWRTHQQPTQQLSQPSPRSPDLC
ncbi:proline-rich protein 36-like [Amborella trichopoda]|uniref:proline-rich protein 36-like n=1 Tax=Amborella trichopoda TaxID=13333 RepID=UPI0009BE9EA1|nr:proline-rich protein 36-like [Amborella trichopoda]|eukprot:XP_020524216.1 proline-rich protein 36-like [Amborella trichopoda]